MNLGEKSMILAKALYSLADSFLPARATRSAGKIKTDSARLPSQADALAEAQSGVIGRIFEFQVRSSSRPGCAESVFRPSEARSSPGIMAEA